MQSNLTNDDDLDGPSREFSLPQEIVPVSMNSSRVIRPMPDFETVPAIAEEQPAAGNADVSRYLHALRRNWLLGSVLGILCAVPLAALMWVLNPKEYTAVELVRVSPSLMPLVFETFENQAKNGYGELRSFKNTQRQLIVQPTALNKALKSSEVASLPQIMENPDPVGWLQKQLKIVYPDDAEMMNVTLTMTDPVAAHKIVSAVVDVYMKDVVEKERADRLRRVDQLQLILSEEAEKARKLRSDLGTLVEKFGTGDPATINISQQTMIQHSSYLRQELSKVQFDLLRAKAELMARAGAQLDSDPDAQGNGSGNSNKEGTQAAAGADGESGIYGLSAEDEQNVILTEALENDREVVGYRREIKSLEAKINLAFKRYDRKLAESFVAKHRLEIEDRKAKLAERTKRVKKFVDGAMAGGSSGGENLQQKIKILEAQAEELRKEMAIVEQDSKKQGRTSIEVELMRNEINNIDPIVDRLTQEIEKTTIEMQSASRITRYESQGVPTVGEAKRRLPLTAVAGLAGLFGPMALLVLLDALRNRVNNIGTINNNMKLPVLGSLPRVPAKIMKRLNDPNNGDSRLWRDRISESVTAVTAMLLRKVASEGHRVVMIASAVPGEGKSTLSEQIARSLADSGHRTLLVDFDLRRPVLHQRFKVPLAPGASDVLRDGVDLKLAAIETDCPNLNLLPAGNTAGSLLRESANGTLDAFFRQCREEYELVIVDSSPLLPVVDGRLVGQHTDGAILAVLKDTSQLGQVMSARNILCDYGITVFGCVVSGDNSGGYYNSYGVPAEKGPIAKGIAASRSTSAM